MVVSVTLSRGALHMAKKRVIVKRLAAIQNLGSMDVLCTDKNRHIDGSEDKAGATCRDTLGEPSERVLELAYLNSFSKRPPQPARRGNSGASAYRRERLVEDRRSALRLRAATVSVLVQRGEQRLLVVKGASEEIVALCTHYGDTAIEDQPALDGPALARLHGRRTALEKEGFRVLGIAWREVALDHPHAVVAMKRIWSLPVLQDFSIRQRRAPRQRWRRCRTAA